jgi:hypothetical protein
VLVSLSALLLSALWPSKKASKITITRADGTEVWMDPPSFGKQHKFGKDLVPSLLRRWLPFSVKKTRLFNYDLPQSIETEHDELVISLRGYSPRLGQPVDVQDFAVGIRASNGDIYPATGKSCMGGESGMMRTSQSFTAWPRGETNLHFALVPWNRGGVPKEEPLEIIAPNPAFRETQTPTWTTESLPASRSTNGVEIRLLRLEQTTNGGPGIYWEIESRHWQPVFEIWRNGQLDPDWEMTSWEAVSPSGNRGRRIGFHETPLQIDGQWFRRRAAPILPTDRQWSLTNVVFPLPTNGFALDVPIHGLGFSAGVAGLFPAGSHTFLNGHFAPGPPDPCVGCVGWMVSQTSSGRGVTNRSTLNPANNVLVIGSRDFPEHLRLVGRLTDAMGHLHIGETTTGSADGAPGYRLEARDFTNRIAPGPARLEIVVQPELRARFIVRPPLP